MGIWKSIKTMILNWAKDFVINNIDKNQDGKITAEEVLDFAQDLIDIYEDITGTELEIVLNEEEE